jgi:hypothetical protein
LALYILARHSGESEVAIIPAVNDTKDNDTIAAIVGAAVGEDTSRFGRNGSMACLDVPRSTTTVVSSS